MIGILAFTAGIGLVCAPLCVATTFHTRPRLAAWFVLGGFILAVVSGAAA